jgi:hypothetical protein
MFQLYKCFCAILCVTAFSFSGKAQSEVGSYFLDGTWAARELNVTDTLHSAIEIYLPGVYFESHHNNRISLSDIIDNNGGRNLLNFSNVLSQLEDNNVFENNLKVNTIGVAVKCKSFQIDFRHNTRLNSTINYPRELAQLVFQGNAQFIGEEVEFGPAINFNSYHEYSLGVSKQFGAFALGGRVKYLSGIGFLRTENSDATLFTDDDIFQLTFDTDYVLSTFNAVNIEGVRDLTFSGDLIENFFSQNSGVAFDIGASFDLNEKLSLTASILDIGSINWNDDTKQFTSQGSFTYEGVDLDNFLLNDSIEFEIKLDTLEDVFAFNESATTAKTTLNTQIYFAGQYKLNDKLGLGALILLNSLEDTEPTIGLNAQYFFNKTLLLGMNYSYRKDSFSNLGLQFSGKIGPLIVFGNTDNIISVLLNENFGFNGRLGIGLSF